MRLVAACTAATFLQVRNGSTHADGQLLAHLEQRVRGAHQHSAHGDGTHNRVIDGSSEQVPRQRLTARLRGLNVRTDCEGE